MSTHYLRSYVASQNLRRIVLEVAFNVYQGSPSCLLRGLLSMFTFDKLSVLFCGVLVAFGRYLTKKCKDVG